MLAFQESPNPTEEPLAIANKIAMADITKEDIVQQPAADNVNTTTNTVDEQRPRKSFFQAALPVFAAGAGLFSDGYVGNVSTLISSIGRLALSC